MAASATWGGINAANAGYNVFQGIGIGLASGVIGMVTGVGVTGALGGGFWGGLGGAVAGGFAGGFVNSFGHGLSAGLDFGSALASAGRTAAITALISAATYGVSYGVTKAYQAIKTANAQARAAGVKTTVGQQGKGSATSSLNANKGETASGTQALSSRGTQSDPDVIRVIKSRSEVSGVEKGAKVYRIWGDDSGPHGKSWTTVDPNAVSNYRGEAGLPPQNTGRFVSEGRLIDTTGVTVKPADSIYGNPGGLEEVVIPDPKNQVQLERVSGVNPEH